jgi:hypothetical protein
MALRQICSGKHLFQPVYKPSVNKISYLFMRQKVYTYRPPVFYVIAQAPAMIDGMIQVAVSCIIHFCLFMNIKTQLLAKCESV